ncbi:hypothetical protein Prudu_560S000100 [Prunus dulcis]|uniref:Transposable element protein n=1 Tax=Prunus dulcis TaxID=3755 RepID=A0A5H2XKT3_PRUDU|nr:hypothetical protein Prudu_560S000100 [Prunus dulcis]
MLVDIREWQSPMREEIEALHAQVWVFKRQSVDPSLFLQHSFLGIVIQNHMPLLVFPITDYLKMMGSLILIQNNIGGLLELCSTSSSRPGITFSVNQACQFIHNPMESHVMAVKRILRYLKGTIDFGIHFQHGLLNLQTYSDDDWAVDPNDRRSILGCIVYLVSSPISWASKKQHTISRSSTEAEYRALAIVIAELTWIRQLFCDYHAVWKTVSIDKRRLEKLELGVKSSIDAGLPLIADGRRWRLNL